MLAMLGEELVFQFLIGSLEVDRIGHDVVIFDPVSIPYR